MRCLRLNAISGHHRLQPAKFNSSGNIITKSRIRFMNEDYLIDSAIRTIWTTRSVAVPYNRSNQLEIIQKICADIRFMQIFNHLTTTCFWEAKEKYGFGQLSGITEYFRSKSIWRSECATAFVQNSYYCPTSGQIYLVLQGTRHTIVKIYEKLKKIFKNEQTGLIVCVCVCSMFVLCVLGYSFIFKRGSKLNSWIQKSNYVMLLLKKNKT